MVATSPSLRSPLIAVLPVTFTVTPPTVISLPVKFSITPVMDEYLLSSDSFFSSFFSSAFFSLTGLLSSSSDAEMKPVRPFMPTRYQPPARPVTVMSCPSPIPSKAVLRVVAAERTFASCCAYIVCAPLLEKDTFARSMEWLSSTPILLSPRLLSYE